MLSRESSESLSFPRPALPLPCDILRTGDLHHTRLSSDNNYPPVGYIEDSRRTGNVPQWSYGDAKQKPHGLEGLKHRGA